MQRIVRRAAQASKQAKRKARVAAEKDRKLERKNNREERVYYQRNILDEARREREARKEDWLLGPLAPRRDVGQRKETYGCVSTNRMQLPKVDVERRPKHFNIAPGDRVCALTGRDKGKIGKVKDVDEERQSVSVEGLNMHDVEYPAFLREQEQDKRPYRPYMVPYHVDDVRLVVPLQDPETGAVEDVLVENVYGGEPYLERPYGSKTPHHTRYIKGLDTEIPWPEEEEPKFSDHKADTRRIDVEQQSYVRNLTSFPFPETVIDELRNKYSKFRTHHDPSYVKAMETRDAYREFKKSRKLLTPQGELMQKRLEELAAKREAAKDETGHFAMSETTENFIDQFMQGKGLKAKPQSKTRPKKESSPPPPQPIKGRFVPGEERAERRKAKMIKKP